jgi:hypothetical protein
MNMPLRNYISYNIVTCNLKIEQVDLHSASCMNLTVRAIPLDTL